MIALIAAMALGSAECRIPLEYAPPVQPFVLISISIDHKPAKRFIVDTGFTGDLLVDKNYALRENLTISDSSHGATTVNGTEAKLQKLSLKSVEIPNVQGKLPADLAVDAETTDISAIQQAVSRDVVGLVGLGFLGRHSTFLDLSKKELVLDSAAPDRDLFESLPMESDGGAESIRLRGTPFLIDTGSLGSSASIEFFNGLAVTQAQSGVFGGVDGSLRLDTEVLAPNIEFGSKKLTQVVLHGSFLTAGRLGIDLLGRYDVYLDFKNAKLSLYLPDTGRPNPSPSGWSGATLYRDSADVDFTILDLVHASPAALSGLEEGDVILKVDGVDISNMSLLAAQQTLDGLPGTDARVECEHRGDVVVRKFYRVSQFKREGLIWLGFTARRDPGKQTVVTAVGASGPAAAAGLQPGDILLQASNTDLTQCTGAEFRDSLIAPVVRLKIQRGVQKLDLEIHA